MHPAIFIQPFHFKIEHEVSLLQCETDVIKGLDYLSPDNLLGLGPNIIDRCELSSAETITLWDLPFFTDDYWNLQYLWGETDIFEFENNFPCFMPGKWFVL